MRRAVAVTFIVAGFLLIPAAGANTPNPTSVTLAGSLQSEAGCAGDWDPACPTTHLTYDANDDVWQGTFTLPAGSYEYKAALNDSWDENYGLNAQFNGANIPLNLASRASVKFYYDHKTHWITDNHELGIAVAVGSFQSELGCPGDWDPAACGPGSRIRAATARTASRRPRSRTAPTRRRWRSARAWTRTTGRAAHRTARTSRSRSRSTTRRSRSRTTRPRTSSRSPSPRRPARPAGPARFRTSTSRARTASAPRATRPRRSGTRSRTACSATSTTRPSTTRTSRRCSTSSPTARPSPTCRRAT